MYNQIEDMRKRARRRAGTARGKRRKQIMNKRLYRSNTNKMVAGVCGGIAEYFRLDPTLVRLGWLLFCAAGGSGFLVYIIAALIIPQGVEEN